ncbi:MAG: RNA polymerase sigma factor [Acidimicrobiia bacterium]|nr:RNA polymerase sigma factor [Acidimicrobiia bacterium]
MDDAERRARFEELFVANFRPLLGYAARRMTDATSAADVVSNVFLVAWRRLDDVPPGDEARLWLYGTARRILANHHRSERRRSALVLKLGAHVTTHAQTESTELAVDLIEALEKLDADDAELLRLTAWEGLTPSQLAQMWGIPATTVRTRLHRARRRLRRELSGNAGPDPDMRQTTGASPLEISREDT